MFGLMTEREHESIMLDLECELVNKTKLTEVLKERIQLGEEYRARLEMEIASLKGKNRELVHKLDGAQIEIEEKLSRIERLNMKIREQQLMLGSFEANWAARNAKEETAETTAENVRRSFVPPVKNHPIAPPRPKKDEPDQQERRSAVPPTKEYPPMPVPEIDEEQTAPIPRRAPLARDDRRREASA